jgi:hypothetical protein
MDTVWLLQDWDELYEKQQKFYYLYAYDLNHLLTRHAIPYPANSSYTLKTTYADDMIKAIIRENMGSLAKVATEVPPTTADTSRDLSAYLTVEADTSKAPSLTKGFANSKTVLDASNDLCDTSANAGTLLFFDIVASNAKTFTFKTYTQYRGTDRTNSAVIFSPNRGNLFNAVISTKNSAEINYVYAKGQGQGSERQYATASDTARIARSMFNRKELVLDSRNPDSGTSVLQSDANAALYAGKPTVSLEALIKDTPNSVYGVDWNFGDIVKVNVGDYTFNAHIKAVTVKVAEGKEDISAVVKAVL